LEQPSELASTTILTVQNVKKRYGKFNALDQINFEIKRGNHLLVLGPNGAGKTTLIKCIMDLVSFDGTIEVSGTDVKRDPRRAKSLIGYVPQNYAFYESLTVYEHARLTTRLKRADRAQMEEKLGTVDLWNVRMRKVRALSDGMKQRLGIALALIGNPPLLLLDEPTSNVDLRGQLEFQALLQDLLKQGKTLLTTTHLTGLGELASEVLVIDKGRTVASGSPVELLGKMNVTDTLYVRVNGGDATRVIELMKAHNATDLNARGEWITASVPNESKLEVVKSLLDSSYKIEDLMIERGKIESEYLKLLGSKDNN